LVIFFKNAVKTVPILSPSISFKTPYC